MTMKETADGVIPKARLVARGFEEQEPVQGDSPHNNKRSDEDNVGYISQHEVGSEIPGHQSGLFAR